MCAGPADDVDEEGAAVLRGDAELLGAVGFLFLRQEDALGQRPEELPQRSCGVLPGQLRSSHRDGKREDPDGVWESGAVGDASVLPGCGEKEPPEIHFPPVRFPPLFLDLRSFVWSCVFVPGAAPMASP